MCRVVDATPTTIRELNTEKAPMSDEEDVTHGPTADGRCATGSASRADGASAAAVHRGWRTVDSGE